MKSPTVRQPNITARSWQPNTVFAVLLGNFMLLGITIGAQGVLWAELLPILRVGKGVFGQTQLVSPLISVMLLLLGGQLSTACGKKHLALASLVFLTSAALVLAGSTNLWGLIITLVLLGAGNGLFETAMNGATLDWEASRGRSVINLMHAGYSAAAVIGALGTGALLGLGWQPGQVLLLLALISGLMLVATLPVRYPPSEVRSDDNRGPTATLRFLFSKKILIVLALLCILGAVGESVANLWSVIFLYERGANAMLGGATFALLSGAMFVGRLLNAPLLEHFGPRTSLLASGVGLILTTVLLLIPGGVWLAVVAFMLLGLAVAGVVPTVLAAASQVAPGQSGAIAGGMLAAVYLSFMISPPIIGWLAEFFSLQAALVIVGLSGLGILWLANNVNKEEKGTS